MNDQEFQSRLGDLARQIDTLPSEHRDRLSRLVGETRQRHDRMKKTVEQLQESLDYLRLSVKYLVFDLEATRRENQFLRQLLKGQDGETLEEGAD